MLRLSLCGTVRTAPFRSLHKIAAQSCCAGQAHTVVSVDERVTQTLATKLAQHLCAGDVYLLTGPVGAGKSVFSRAFIRAAYEDDLLPVPSPTYLLQNIYDELEGPEIHHFDLYRLDHPASMARLQLDQSFQDAVSLVEWAERLPENMRPVDRLDIDIMPMQVESLSDKGAQPDDQYIDARQRVIRLTPYGEKMVQRCQELLPEP